MSYEPLIMSIGIIDMYNRINKFGDAEHKGNISFSVMLLGESGSEMTLKMMPNENGRLFLNPVNELHDTGLVEKIESLAFPLRDAYLKASKNRWESANADKLKIVNFVGFDLIFTMTGGVRSVPSGLVNTSHDDSVIVFLNVTMCNDDLVAIEKSMKNKLKNGQAFESKDKLIAFIRERAVFSGE